MLALAAWLGGREDHLAAVRAMQAGRRRARAAPPAPAGLAAGAVLLVQMALGGWVSTNYATLACNDFPLCDGQMVPPMDFDHGFTLWRELGKTPPATTCRSRR